MIKRVLVVSMVGLSLVGCVNNDTLSGDVYTASEAKQNTECQLWHHR